MASKLRNWRHWLFRTSRVRASLEALLIGISLLTLLFQSGDDLPDIQYFGYATSILFLCAIVFALRLPLPSGLWWQQLFFETIFGITTVLLIVWLLFQFGSLFIPTDRIAKFLIEEQIWIDVWYALILFPFIMLRTLKHASYYWQNIRRKYLVWELTHGHLLFVILTLLLLSGGFIIWLSLVETGPFLINLFTRLIGVVAVGSGPFIIFLFVILSPLSFLAYYTSRRITQRLQTLSRGIDALRDSDYQARVLVNGEDEVAKLQSDFNAMAEDLENALNELKTERDMVTSLLKSRRELFAAVSHDLRTPIATLRAYIQSTLKHESDTITPNLRLDLEVLEGEVIQLQNLIDDLFTIARTELDKLELKIENIDLIPLLNRIVKSTTHFAWQKGKIQLNTDLPQQLPLVKLDKVRLEQIMNNLLHNSIKYTSPGGVVIVSAVAEQDIVEIQVKDTGGGISVEDLPHIWEPFFRSHNSHSKNVSGSGLGLTMVKNLTEAMGGLVTVESEIGIGSCFKIRFPLI